MAGNIIEVLAAVEHQRWSHWQAYLHGVCERNDDGSLTIPAALVERWERQIATPYDDLSEVEKESDRAEVRKTMAAIHNYMKAV